ncbi:MAG: hypothetical protein JRJ87_06665 [Deltaproteobacteria bacterium]|nr:hypothetical protein [Deltaproteobacteria bacterium]
MRCIITLFLLFSAGSANGQTIVEMNFASAKKILENHDLAKGILFLTRLTNNYKKYENVRIHSNWNEESIAALTKALKTDFDGSGKEYIKDMTIWSVTGQTGLQVYMAASMLDQDSILLSSSLTFMKAMMAFEILAVIRQGRLTLSAAQNRALSLGIEMQVTENDDGEQIITFFGYQRNNDTLVSKLIVFEPPDLVWN